MKNGLIIHIFLWQIATLLALLHFGSRKCKKIKGGILTYNISLNVKLYFAFQSAETTGTTFAAMIILLGMHPDVQVKRTLKYIIFTNSLRHLIITLMMNNYTLFDFGKNIPGKGL